MSNKSEELAKLILTIADGLQDEWDGGDHADTFDKITAQYIDRISTLIDSAFAKVREECAERGKTWLHSYPCPIKPSEYDSLRTAILGTEAK